MKRLGYLLLVLLLAAGSINAQQVSNNQTSATSSNGKEFLLNYYQQTFEALKKSTEGLSSAQLHFKPATDRWSVAQCMEHILATEKTLFDYAKQTMEKPATPERRSEVKSKDEEIVRGITDRSFKAKATDDITGKNQLNDVSDALTDLQNNRKVILGYLDAVKESDLRDHITDSPFGPIDAYQSFLFIAGHTSRHTLQIEEVKADKNFPKK